MRSSKTVVVVRVLLRVARVTNDTWVRHGSVVTGSYLRGGVTPCTTLMGGHFYLWVFLGVMSVVFTVVKV